MLKTTGNALFLDRADILGSVYLNNLRSDGAVRMAASQIKSNLYCGGAKLPELYCRNMKLAGELWWGGIHDAEHTKLDLTGVVLRALLDDKNSWPSKNNRKLNALVYKDLYSHTSATPEQWRNNTLPDPLPLEANERIEWLKLQPNDKEVEPQPWFELAKLLEARGKKDDAKHVIHALRLEQARPYAFLRRRLVIAVAWLEEDLFRVLKPLAILITLGLCLYWPAQHAMAPTDRAVYLEWAQGKPFQGAYPKFQPLIYTIENALPIIKLGQDDKWGPDPRHRPLFFYWVLSGFRWILIASGWLQATLLVAAINQRFKS
jgi:hypothetical protein